MKIRLHYFFAFFVLLLNSFQLSAQVADYSASPSSGCAPLTVVFHDLSSPGSTSWTWNFGNGNSANAVTPTDQGALYSTPGVYHTTLTLSNGSTKNISITVFTKPVANFSSTSPSCEGQLVTFTDSSTPGDGALTQWNWDFGDGSQQTTATGSTTHTFATSGVFPVKLIVTDANGCLSNITNSITITASPVANFSANTLGACSVPLTITFTNSSTSTGAVSYSWDFGDPASGALNNSIVTNPSHTYNALGSYAVTLTATQPGCADTEVKTNYIVAASGIVVDFASNQSIICEGETINFTDFSNPLSTSSTWNFGDGTTSLALNPSHTYSTAGTYHVTLNATTAGCSGSVTKNNFITVNPGPTAAFTADNTHSCTAPFTVNFTDQSTNALSWLWDFGDGTTSSLQNPTHTFVTEGAFNVSLTVVSANGCSKQITKPNFISVELLVNFDATPKDGCAPLLVHFSAASTTSTNPITSYSWDFGDGTTGTGIAPNHTFAIGVYTIKLTVTNSAGCSFTLVKTNHVKASTKPTANFTVVDPTICHGKPGLFTDLSIGADSAYWQFLIGQGSFTTPSGATLPFSPVSNIFPDTGTFNVMQIVYNSGCPDTLQLNNIITVYPPKPLFTKQQNCADPFTVSFTNTSWGSSTVVWDFGDPASGLLNNSNALTTITHTYSSIGLKTIKLIATNTISGCVDSISMSITIADPIASFTANPNPGCAPLPVTFINTSQDSDITTWLLGDGGSTTNTNNFSYTYATPGLYTAALAIKDINGCVDTTRQAINVRGPVVNFAADILTGCTPLEVQFHDSTKTNPSGSSITQWAWSFGDQASGVLNKSNLQNPTHTYNSSGLYSDTLIVTDNNGCSQTFYRSNYIEATFPIPQFVSNTIGCAGDVISYDATATNVSWPATFNWNFGDGTTSNGPITTHSYTTNNNFTATLIVTDKNGCTDSIKHQILISKPVANFTTTIDSINCGFSKVSFTDNSTLSPTSWQWNFGDGGTSILQNPSHNYTTPGSQTVTLIIKNLAGCADTISGDSVIVPGPIGTFSFSPTTGCIPLTVNFTALSPNATSFTWDFGDGSVITVGTNTASHIYNNPIIATPQLILGEILPNGSPCPLAAPPAGKITVTDRVSIKVDSIFNLICFGGLTGSIYTKSTGGTLPYTFAWSTTPVQNTSFASNLSAGSYTLTVTDSNGCSTFHDTILAQPTQIVNTASAPDTICLGQSANISALAFGGTGLFTYVLFPSNDTLIGGTMVVSPTNDSTFKIIAYDDNHCVSNSDSAFITVYNIALTNFNLTAVSPICPGQTSSLSVQINGANPGPITYLWNNNLGSGSGPFTITPNQPNLYFVTITNSCGSSYTDSTQVIFNPQPIINYSYNTTNPCINEPLLFVDSSLTGNLTDPITSWNWNFGDTGSGASNTSNQQNPIHIYNNSGVYPVTLTVATAGGCSSTTTGVPFSYIIHPQPTAQFVTNSSYYNLPYDPTICTNQSSNANLYNWNFGDGATDTMVNPSHLYSLVGSWTIELIATSQFGCKDTATAEIITIADVTFPNVFTPNANGAPGGSYNINNLDNDVFHPYTSGVIDYKLDIFDRWGELIFESQNINEGWDGYYKGKLCQQGVYIWKAYVKLNNGKVFNKSGDVTLLR